MQSNASMAAARFDSLQVVKDSQQQAVQGLDLSGIQIFECCLASQTLFVCGGTSVGSIVY
jgi:hypothetical protein